MISAPRTSLLALLIAAGLVGICIAPFEATAAPPAKNARDRILESPAWQQAMESFNEWLSVQQIYDKSEIPQVRARMSDMIGKLSAQQLAIYLQDMQQKLALINSSAAAKSQANILYNMNVASDALAAKLRAQLPNPVTMTADQMKQTLVNLQQQENDTRADEAAFQQQNAQEIAMIQAQNKQTAAANAAADAAGLGNYGGGPYTPRNPMPQYSPAPIIAGITWPW